MNVLKKILEGTNGDLEMEGGAVKGGAVSLGTGNHIELGATEEVDITQESKRGRFGGKTEKTTIKTTAVPVRIRGAGNIRFYSTKQNGKGAILLAGSTIESNNTSIELEAVVCGTASDHFEERVKKSGGNHVTGKKELRSAIFCAPVAASPQRQLKVQSQLA